MATVVNPLDTIIQADARTQNVTLPSEYSVDFGQLQNVPPLTNEPTIATTNPTGSDGVDGDAWYNSSTAVMWFKINGTWYAGGTINASSITTGTLSAARIGTNSITASKISVSTLSAIAANLGTVTAGSITGTADIDITGTAVFNGNNSSDSTIWAGVFNDSESSTNGIIGYSGASTGVGIRGNCSGSILSSARGVEGVATIGIGVHGTASSGVGVKAVASSGTALQVLGTMTISSTTLVNNLNAQRWNGCTNSGVSTGSSTATFNGANKPGSSSTNTWWNVVIGATTYRIPVWT
jgi:hypothetical protein